jgi:hypothetical protein
MITSRYTYFDQTTQKQHTLGQWCQTQKLNCVKKNKQGITLGGPQKEKKLMFIET